MEVLFSGTLLSDYSQAYVVSDEYEGVDMPESFRGQQNGLLGAAADGSLFLSLGHRASEFAITVERHETEPVALGEEWQDVVEASFRPSVPSVVLHGWGGMAQHGLGDFPHETYRVRYAIADMDAAHTYDEPLDRHLLQFWPAPPAPDRVVRCLSENGPYSHAWARELPPPPSADEVAAFEAETLRIAEELEAQQLAAAELRTWGGRPPSEALRRIGGGPPSLLAQVDRDLVDEIERLPPERLHPLVVFSMRRAYAFAGLADRPWVAPALDALERGLPLPPPFDSIGPAAWEAFQADPDVEWTTMTLYDGHADNVLRQAVVVSMLQLVQHEDPLEAALNAVYQGMFAHGTDYPAFLADVRRWIAAG